MTMNLIITKTKIALTKTRLRRVEVQAKVEVGALMIVEIQIEDITEENIELGYLQ